MPLKLTRDGTMNRRIKNRDARAGVLAKIFSLTTLVMMLAMAVSVIWTQASAQDSPAAPIPPQKPVPADATPTEGKIPSDPYEVWIALGAFRYPLALTSIIVVWFTIERMVVLRYG